MGEARRREQFMMQNNVQPGGRIPPGTHVQVDLTKAAQRECVCGCKHFIQAVTVHVVSALLSSRPGRSCRCRFRCLSAWSAKRRCRRPARISK